MNRKLKNTLILIVLLLIIVVAGTVFTFFSQQSDIDSRKKKLNDLNLNAYNTEELVEQLNTLKFRAIELDSILALRKFNIPVNLHQSEFYNFINRVSFNFAPESFVNIEYNDIVVEQHYKYYTYKLSGTAYFNDVYEMIYAVDLWSNLTFSIRTNRPNLQPPPH